jgi:hypothetical protein
MGLANGDYYAGMKIQVIESKIHPANKEVPGAGDLNPTNPTTSDSDMLMCYYRLQLQSKAVDLT